jgi:hypothetical protein
MVNPMATEIKTIEDIYETLNWIAATMTEKGIFNPRASLDLKLGGSATGWLLATLPTGGESAVQFDGDDAAAVLADMLNHAAT